jgi:hypothetical protein
MLLSSGLTYLVYTVSIGEIDESLGNLLGKVGQIGLLFQKMLTSRVQRIAFG